jgi:hypothetical protein
MPAGLSPADQELWKTCNGLHKTYKATQAEVAVEAKKMDKIEQALQNNRASPQDKVDYCEMLEGLIKLVQRLHRERLDYMKLDCDKFDWFNTGSTPAERLKAHQDENGFVSAQIRNLFALQKRFCG